MGQLPRPRPPPVPPPVVPPPVPVVPVRVPLFCDWVERVVRALFWLELLLVLRFAFWVFSKRLLSTS